MSDEVNSTEAFSDFPYVVNPQGDVVRIKKDELVTALNSGYIPASQKQVEEFNTQDELERRYNTPLQKGAAFARGAVGAFLPGVTELATRGVAHLAGVPEDITKEVMEEEEQHNKEYHAAGTAAGILGSMVTGAGAPALIGKGETAVAKGVEALLPKATSNLGKLATKTLSSAAGGGFAGVSYGTGELVHEAALGDPNLTAQHVISTVGISGLLGGGVGAGMGLLGSGIKAFGESDAANKIRGWLDETEAHANLRAAGATKAGISKLVRQKGEENVNKIAKEMYDNGLVGGFMDSPKSVLSKATALADTANEKAAQVLSQAELSPTAPQFTWGNLREELTPKMIQKLGSAANSEPAIKPFTDALDSLSRVYGDEPMTLSGLRELRSDVGKMIDYNKANVTSFQKPLSKTLRNLYGELNDKLAAGIESAGGDGAAWKAANREMEVALTAKGIAEKALVGGGYAKNVKDLLSPMNVLTLGVGSLAGGPMGAIATAAARQALKRYGSSVTGAAARGINRILEAGDVAAIAHKTAEMIAEERQAGTDALAAAAHQTPEAIAALGRLESINSSSQKHMNNWAAKVAKGLGIGHEEAAAVEALAKPTEEGVKEYMKTEKQLMDLNDPERMVDHLTKVSADLHEHAPETAQALQIAAGRAVQYLRSKLPTQPQAGPLATKTPPPQTEIARFNRYKNALEDPVSLLKQAAAGTLTTEAVEAVSTVLPDYYKAMQSAVLEKVIENHENMPYKAKMMTSLLLGQDLDGTTAPQSIINNQGAHFRIAGGFNHGGGTKRVRGSSSGLGKISLPSRLLTPMQLSNQRGRK